MSIIKAIISKNISTFLKRGSFLIVF